MHGPSLLLGGELYFNRLPAAADLVTAWRRPKTTRPPSSARTATSAGTAKTAGRQCVIDRSLLRGQNSIECSLSFALD